jgi:hypothetical protein
VPKVPQLVPEMPQLVLIVAEWVSTSELVEQAAQQALG